MHNHNLFVSLDSRTPQHPSAESKIRTLLVETVLALHRSSRARTGCLRGLVPRIVVAKGLEDVQEAIGQNLRVSWINRFWD